MFEWTGEQFDLLKWEGVDFEGNNGVNLDLGIAFGQRVGVERAEEGQEAEEES